MKKIITLCFVSLFFYSCNSSGDWVSLFNGKNLEGWVVYCQPQDKDKVFWTVDNGTILCNSEGMTGHHYVWLATEREFSNFELQLKFQAFRDFSGNSGVQFHSRYDTTLKGGGWLNGPQVDINPGGMLWRTGLIYDETFEEQRWIYPDLPNAGMPERFEPEEYIFKFSDEGDGWNEMTIVCEGTHIKTIVNGIVRTDWDGDGVLNNENHRKYKIDKSGHIALQLHQGDNVKMRYKDIRIKELP